MAHRIVDASLDDVPLLVDVIRKSFADVAARFGLTPENCPKHPSNCAPEWIDSTIRKGVRYFVLYLDGVPAGCVAVEQGPPGVCYLERLAVLPEHRRLGLGRALVDRTIPHAVTLGAVRVEIGIIAAQEDLKEWYRRIGFIETRTAVFPHLPFTVCFMAKGLQTGR
ncbi:MAG: GNAT family N-acetyltransferase [Syntrophobacteraceae bacterium]|nr:GNAT family N-acetyltransferase [Desulfobacteraceae bacterium]